MRTVKRPAVMRTIIITPAPPNPILRIYEAIAQVTQAIYAQHPDVLIDLTFELWGQKHTIDYGLLRAADLSWISNVGDNTDDAAGPRQARTLLYQRSLAIPVETMLIGNLRAETGDPREKFATALGSCPLLLGDLRRLTAEQIAWYGEKIRWHRQLRREINLSESFFPLGSWRQPSVVEWDGFARLSRIGRRHNRACSAMRAMLHQRACADSAARLVALHLDFSAERQRTAISRLPQIFAPDLKSLFDGPVMIIEVRLCRFTQPLSNDLTEIQSIC